MSTIEGKPTGARSAARTDLPDCKFNVVTPSLRRTQDDSADSRIDVALASNGLNEKPEQPLGEAMMKRVAKLGTALWAATVIGGATIGGTASAQFQSSLNESQATVNEAAKSQQTINNLDYEAVGGDGTVSLTLEASDGNATTTKTITVRV
ncbi:MAG: hypothetical protein AAGC56_10480, partial [Pseudomonadota bacterium]